MDPNRVCNCLKKIKKMIGRDKNKTFQKISLIFFVVLNLFFISCTKETEITGEEKQKILNYAEPIADSILKGFNENNYEIFSKYFDTTMKKALNEENFYNTRKMIYSRIGLYVSKNKPQIFRKPPFIAVVYKANFEKEQNVVVRLVLQQYGKEYLVTGLWFNSPKLREK